MKPGDLVRVRAFGGEELTRRVVELWGESVLICREEEYLTAQKEGRHPSCVGFKVNDVLRVEKSSPR